MSEFRSMRRKKQQLSQSDCDEVLKTEKRGFFALNGENGYPYVIPIDYIYDGESHIYFHGAKEGLKIDLIERCNKVCFTVCEQGSPHGDDWSYYARSVVVFGKVRLMDTTQDSLEKLRSLASKYYPEGSEKEIEDEIRKYTSTVRMFDIEIEHMTGKIVHEK